MTESNEKRNSRKRTVRQTLLIGGAFILGFVVLGVIAIQVWEYSNSVAFCANACHDVHPEEIPAYQDSYHANDPTRHCHRPHQYTPARLSPPKHKAKRAGTWSAHLSRFSPWFTQATRRRSHAPTEL